MRTVTKRELNQNTAAVLDSVTPADDLVVTERGTPRWRVSTVREQDTALARLEREGRYSPPVATPAPWPQRPGGPSYTGEQLDDMLDEMRGDH